MSWMSEMARLSSGIGRPWLSGGSNTDLSVTDRLIEIVDNSLHTLICPVETEQNRSLLGVRYDFCGQGYGSFVVVVGQINHQYGRLGCPASLLLGHATAPLDRANV
jgi:hypothetical protein